jgi:glycosyltransferase involved in cell wall biosynthesis
LIAESMKPASESRSDRPGVTPFVSVVMPIRNEANFLDRSLGSVLAQDYPRDRFEIIVADGMSDDGTRELVERLRKDHAHLILVDNTGRIVPTGLNAGIACARGDVVIRIDGHAEVAPDFIRQNVALLEEHPDAWAVGGPITHKGRNTFGKAVALAMSSPLGVGLASHHFPGFEGYVGGAPFPALRKWIFERVGLFDANLVRNQDDEFNFRILQAGGKCYISPRVRSEYYVRESPRKLFRQYFQYSFWRIPVIRKHRRPTTLRQVVPPLFFGTMLALLVLGIVLKSAWVALTLPALYAVALLLLGLSTAPRAGIAVALLVPVAVATMHLAYAVGIAYGFFSAFFRPGAWDHAGTMAALSR